MVLPWIVQESLGVGPPRERSKRVENPTNATPTAFHMDWSHSENGPTDPKAVVGVSTFMGVPKTPAAGLGKKWPDDCAASLQKAIHLLRKEGFTCKIPPDDHDDGEDESDESKEELKKKDPELAYLRENYYKDIELEKDNETAIAMTVRSDWLYVRCASEAASAAVEEKLSGHFALGRARHEERTIPIREDVVVTVRTGNGGDGVKDGGRPGTLFELGKGSKVVSKCLCSYSNGEMDSSGPTIELFETAAQWQQHGYGAELMAIVEEHFENTFVKVAEQKRVKFNVCYCTNRHACQWFLSQGFEDWDGMGEELGKYLFEE